MSRQGFNNPLLLWSLLLALLMAALMVYGYFHPSPTPIAPQSPANNSLSTTEEKSPRLITSTISKPIESSVLATATITPVGLDPDTAREAVHQVENGVYARATAIFEQETVEIEWATAYEQSLRDMFAQHQGLQRVSINSIACHASMCRIEVFTPRDTDADFFTAMFYDGLANFRQGELNAEAAITRQMELGMTSVYVARKGYVLGFY